MMVTGYKMRKCQECGVLFEGRYAGRALAGHLWLKHQQRAGIKAKLEGEIARSKRQYNELVARFNALVDSKEQLELAQSATVSKAKEQVEEAGKCPFCGFSLSTHHRFADILMGKGFRCP